MDIEQRIVDALCVEVKRRRLVFVQTNALLVECLSEKNTDGKFDSRICADLPLAGGLLKDLPVMLTDVDTHVFASLDPPSALGGLRVLVNDLLDSGVDVCLVSQAPRIAFPDCVGSDVLDDAHAFRVDSAGDLTAEEVVGHCWRDPVDLESLVATLESLGPDVCSLLDVLLFETQQTRSVPLGLATDREWEALRLSGLATLDAGGRTVTLTLSPGVLSPAIAETISRRVTVQDEFFDVMRDLVSIERGLRQALRRRAHEKHGDAWRGQVLPQAMADEASRRASSELRRTISSVKGLRDPFEWISLGELVEVVRTREWADRLGQSDEFWRTFASEVLPVRNRIGHMRLLRRADPRSVNYWSTRMGLMFKALQR